MKKKIIAGILCFIVIAVAAAPLFTAGDTGKTYSQKATDLFSKGLGKALTGITGGLNSLMNENSSFIPEDEYAYDNFYEGTAEFIKEAKENAVWSLGKAEASLIPENHTEYSLFLGGFLTGGNGFKNDVREILDDMKVRVIALSDGSERGITVFATVDAIGVSNGDIRQIRQMLSSFAKQNNINAINIFATHAHSCIDTQGLWTDIQNKWPVNFRYAFTGKGESVQGTDEKYMSFFRDRVKSAIEKAVSSMEKGKMTYAEKSLPSYFSNKNRQSASYMDDMLRRIAFYPENEKSTPTFIVNMAAHPDVAGLAVEDDPVKGHGISGDYVYYIGETLNKLGYDFMFFNGAICGIYIGRPDVNTDRRVEIPAGYGKEVAQITYALTMTEEEILADENLMSFNFTAEQTQGHENFTLWYENWETAEEKEIEPILNLRLKTVELQATNPIIKVAAKLGLVNYQIRKTAAEEYFLTTEIGYMEMGKELKFAFVPGEFCADLIKGGASLTADGSVSAKDFEGRTLSEIFGEDIIVFGLANDAIGYIVPDNDYCMCLGMGHYHETLSLGEKTASTIMKGFEELRKEV